MYWPCGVPRIHAYDGSKSSEIGADVHDGASRPSDEVDADTTETGSDQPMRTDGEHGNSIFDLRVARLDHIFVTVSASCLTIWSSRVSSLLLLEILELIYEAYDRFGKGGTFGVIYQSVWSECRSSSAPRRLNRGSPDSKQLPLHLLNRLQRPGQGVPAAC